jgi:hypothetical protein
VGNSPEAVRMKQISLTQGKVALVDDEDFERLSAFRWHVHDANGKIYARRTCLLSESHRHEYMHHAVLGFGVRTDHRDGDGLNNTRLNLRPCTQSQNMANSPPREGRRFKGIEHLSSGRFRAVIAKDGKRTRLGIFDSEEEAARAYDQRARETFGEFARLNFPSL